MSTADTQTEEEKRIEEDKKRSAEYTSNIQLAISARMRNEDGTVGEPGVLPQEDLEKIYSGQPLENKDKEITKPQEEQQAQAT